MDYSVVQQCMHCGMCLPTCPTYGLTNRERHGPRGRIALMRAIADKALPLEQAFGHEMDFCLGCLACQSACPADVDYAQLFEAARASVQEQSRRPWLIRAYRRLTLGWLFRSPRAMRAFGRVMERTQRWGLFEAVVASPLMGLVSKKWERLIGMTPTMERAFSHQLIAEVERPKGKTRYRVGMLTGCIQDIAYASINRATVDVLLENDCEVITPAVQSCCGSIHGHNGEVAWAKESARKTIDAFPIERLDAIISNAGGCGSHLRHYGRLLAQDSEYAERARQWDAKVRDIHEWLVDIDFRKPTASLPSQRVTYHESCHLCHGQRITSQPRTVLASIPGLEIVSLTESNVCCGSAGVYSITQPEASDALLKTKVQHLLDTDADVVATSNPGCDLQLKRGLDEAGSSMRVCAPVTLLAEAYRA